MSVKVHLTPMLVRHLGVEEELDVEAKTLGGVLERLDARYPGFKDSVCEETGRIRIYLNFFLNGSILERDAKVLSKSLSEGDELYIMASVAGGVAGP